MLARVTSRTRPVRLQLSGNHVEEISFFVIKTLFVLVILGHPWLVKHNPRIDWPSAKITGWSTPCHASCLHSAQPQANPLLSVCDSSIDLACIPSDYLDLQAVFSKDQALSLPPHRPYDCAIELLSGATLPSSRLCSLSRPERETMEAYIKSSLAAGIIRPC